MTTPTEQSIRDECENALAWTTEKCPNAPYVPLKRETVERLIEALAGAEAEGVPVEFTPTLLLCRQVDRIVELQARVSELETLLRIEREQRQNTTAF